ncbi:MAG: sulfatase [Verrucomicrobiota bacterium]
MGLAAGFSERPNFIVIFVDDLGYGDLGCYGSPNIRTPRIDRMAEEGLRLTSFYVGSSVCSASRASLLTGRYAARHGTKGVYFPGVGGLASNEVTIAEMLKAEGYATACVGKWHLGDNPEFLPTRQGFDLYYGIPYSNDMYIGPNQKFSKNVKLLNGYTLEKAMADQSVVASDPSDRKMIKQENKLGDLVPLMEGEEIVEYPADQSTLTERYFDKAINFIKEREGDPFFVFLTPTMPHIPLFATPQFIGKSERGLYGDTVEEIDWHVGRLLDFLDTEGLSEDTLAIFTSDNGPWLNLGDRSGSAGPLRDGKFSNYEGGVRVPSIIWWPGKVPAGKVSSAVVSTIDLLPTFAAYSGAKLPEVTIDGYNVSKFLGDPDAGFERDSFLYLKNGKPIGIRKGDWKYMPDGAHRFDRDNRGPELYNLRFDVHERDNRVESMRNEVVRLAAAIEAFRLEFEINESK